jgi:ElaB/YqjD/DUF883 family membrane-anchored ribosome-binding protein
MTQHRDNLSEGANTVVGDITDAAGKIGHDLQDIGNSVKNAAGEQFEHVRDRAKGYIDSGRKHARDVEHGIEAYISEQPLKSILIAVGIGWAVGMLWRRH